LKQPFTLCATLLALGIGGIGTASAQPYYYYGSPRPPAYVGPRLYGPGLPPHEIIAIVRAAGLAPLTQPVRRGPGVYVLVAAGRAGEQLRVVVDAYAGEIMRVSPVMAMRPYGAPLVAAYPYDPRPRGALVQREIKDPPPGTYGPNARFDTGVPPVPPRSVPNARLANAPTDIAQPPAAKPQYAPLPRPRPSVAAAAPTAQPAAPPPAVTPAQPQAAPAPAIKEERASKPEPPTMAPVTPLD
jgi:hypothetical protein